MPYDTSKMTAEAYKQFTEDKATGRRERKKPTIAELEAILNGPECDVVVMPGGQVLALPKKEPGQIGQSSQRQFKPGDTVWRKDGVKFTVVAPPVGFWAGEDGEVDFYDHPEAFTATDPNQSAESPFKFDSLAWHIASREQVKIIGQDGLRYWIRDGIGNRGECEATDLSHEQPESAEPVPQKCPNCGGDALCVAASEGKSFVRCFKGSCLMAGPIKPTSLEAIQAWDSIHIGSPWEKADIDEPLTEEWLRKVGLCDWSCGLRGPFQFESPHPGGCTVHYKLSGLDANLADYVCIRTTCKTVGDVRQLCRLLGVPIKE